MLQQHFLVPHTGWGTLSPTVQEDNFPSLADHEMCDAVTAGEVSESDMQYMKCGRRD